MPGRVVVPRAGPTVATLLPHLARTARATWAYVPLVPDCDARARALRARARVLIGYCLVLGYANADAGSLLVPRAVDAALGRGAIFYTNLMDLVDLRRA
jgi:hypothetical protein